MARTRHRVRLEDGLWLDLNDLLREGFFPRGNKPLIVGQRWTSNHFGEIASAIVTAHKEGENGCYLRITDREV